MANELGLEQLLHEIVLHWFFVLLDIWLIRSTMKGTNIFLNPPEWVKSFSQSTWFGRLLEGKRGAYFIYIAAGAGLMVAGVGLINRLIILARGLGYL